MRYPLTFYVKSLPVNVGGCANAFVIRIHEKYRDDVGIYRHELLHVKQWATLFSLGLLCAAITAFAPGSTHPDLWWTFAIAGFGAHSFAYLVSHQYRLWCEVEAFKEQLRNNPADWPDYTELYASSIASKYRLRVTTDQALRLLRA